MREVQIILIEALREQNADHVAEKHLGRFVSCAVAIILSQCRDKGWFR
tara:strand:- start:508 stop:651 length:144 start_codon:yes stop_codon:yes gene_type:complete